jgi:ferritin-like metal-binding protein YciE
MSNAPGAQVQANKHEGRNRPSDIDELRDNVTDIASSVGDMASRQYEQAYDVATDAFEETGRIIRRKPLSLLQKTLEEEEATDEALAQIAKTAVNQEAEAA